MISNDEIQKIGHLARLKLDPSELDGLRNDLNNILQYFEVMQSIDIKDIPLTDNVLHLQNIFRADIVDQSLPTGEIQKLAPQWENGHFVVPRVI